MTTTTTTRAALPAGFCFPSFAAFADEWRRIRSEARETLRREYRYQPARYRWEQSKGFKFIQPREQNLFALGSDNACVIFPADGYEWDGTLRSLAHFIDYAISRGAVSVGVEQGFDGSDYMSRDFDCEPWIHSVALTLWEKPEATTPNLA